MVPGRVGSCGAAPPLEVSMLVAIAACIRASTDAMMCVIELAMAACTDWSSMDWRAGTVADA